MNFDFRFFGEVLESLPRATVLTLQLTVWSFVIGFILAVGITLIRMAKVPVLTAFFEFYISFLRGTPVILQLYLVYYILPALIDNQMIRMGNSFRMAQIGTTTLVILTLAVNASAYLSETLRGGLISIGRGEIEAAYSIGMTRGMVFRRIIFPQVIAICIPNFATNLINILHGTSLAFFVSVMEITGTARIMAHDNWKYYEAFVASGVFYWLLTMGIELIAYLTEKGIEKNGYSLKVH